MYTIVIIIGKIIQKSSKLGVVYLLMIAFCIDLESLNPSGDDYDNHNLRMYNRTHIVQWTHIADPLEF